MQIRKMKKKRRLFAVLVSGNREIGADAASEMGKQFCTVLPDLLNKTLSNV
jgi:hypothetical protein